MTVEAPPRGGIGESVRPCTSCILSSRNPPGVRPRMKVFATPS